MTAPRQFLESFLQEKTTAWAQARPHLTVVHDNYFGEPLSQHAEQFMPSATLRAVVEDVRQSDDTASAITREHYATADIRRRYRLKASGENWRIIGIDRECYFCGGTGQSGCSRCQRCNGEGWRDSTTKVA